MIHRRFAILSPRGKGTGGVSDTLEMVGAGALLFAPIIVLPAAGYLIAGSIGSFVGTVAGLAALFPWMSILMWSGK